MLVLIKPKLYRRNFRGQTEDKIRRMRSRSSWERNRTPGDVHEAVATDKPSDFERLRIRNQTRFTASKRSRRRRLL